jgi:hypothetical protein
MTRAVQDGGSNLEILVVWRKDAVLDSLGDLMKMWVVLGKISYGVQSRPPEQVKCRFTDNANDCRQNSSEESKSKIVVVWDTHILTNFGT